MVYLVGQKIVLYMYCTSCGTPISFPTAQRIGLCKECVEKIGIPLRDVLVVNPPTAASKWN